MDSISPEYSHDFYSGQCGIVRDMYFKVKHDLYRVLSDINDIIYNFDEMMEKSNPRELVSSFEEKLAGEHPFWRAWSGPASDAIQSVSNLESGLFDLEHLFERLSKIGKLEWATALVDSVRDLETDIKAFLVDIDKDTFTLHWKIETHEGLGKLRLIYETQATDVNMCFSTEHNREMEYFKWRERRKQTVTVKDITDEVQYRLRKHLDNLLEAAGFPED